MGFVEEYKRASAGDETQHYQVAGLRVKCVHCDGEDFDQGDAMLNTRGLTFLGLDWVNRKADLLICTTCGEVRWFLERPERI